MTLDNEFKEQTEKLVSETLELYKNAGASPRIGDVWKCENTGDFLCGFFVGEMVGSALSAFQVYHKREPSAEEHMEIVELWKNIQTILLLFSQNSIQINSSEGLNRILLGKNYAALAQPGRAFDC